MPIRKGKKGSSAQIRSYGRLSSCHQPHVYHKGARQNVLFSGPPGLESLSLAHQGNSLQIQLCQERARETLCLSSPREEHKLYRLCLASSSLARRRRSPPLSRSVLRTQIQWAPHLPDTLGPGGFGLLPIRKGKRW